MWSLEIVPLTARLERAGSLSYPGPPAGAGHRPHDWRLARLANWSFDLVRGGQRSRAPDNQCELQMTTDDSSERSLLLEARST
jgi:hypothetical protein